MEKQHIIQQNMHSSRAKKHFVIVGNPNTGKTSLFNVLTDSLNQTGNWSGVTINSENKVIPSATIPQVPFEVELIDTPGVYSIIQDEARSADQQEIFNLLSQDAFDGIINVVDGSNVERNLYLTLQLLQLKKPMILCINFSDIAYVDAKWTDALKKILRLPVITISSHSGIGVDSIKSWIAGQCQNCDCLGAPLSEGAEAFFEGAVAQYGMSRILTMKALEEPHASDFTAQQIQDDAMKQIGQPASLFMMSARLELIRTIKSQMPPLKHASNTQNLLDKLAFHPVIGPLVFMLMMLCMFTFSIVIGGAFQDPIEVLVSGFLVDGAREMLSTIGLHEFIVFLIADGIGGGIATVAAFIPIVWALFIFLSYIEESGYIARAAVMADGLLKKIGLPGAAFIPLIVGFGCNVPAISAVKSLDSFSAKVKTAVMLPFMSCSARLTVYAVFCSAFFKEMGALVIFMLYLMGIAAAILTGWIIDRFGGFKTTRGLVIELPLYRWPKWSVVYTRSWNRVWSFIAGAGKTIVLIFVVVQMLSAGVQHLNLSDAQWGKIKAISVAPFRPMGLTENEWQLVAGLAAGVVAKEVTVGTLSALYSLSDSEPQLQEFKATRVVQSAWNEFLINIRWEENTTLSHDRAPSLAKTLSASIDDKIAMMSYLIFVLLYFPCISVYAVTKQEVGIKWAIFSAIWSTSLAYLCSVIFYQILSYC